MLVGCPAEIKRNEARVALTPAGVRELWKRGHAVIVETRAGIASGFSDDDYRHAGATIADTADEVWEQADLIVKVKEPQSEEYPKMRVGQILFTYTWRLIRRGPKH